MDRFIVAISANRKAAFDMLDLLAMFSIIQNAQVFDFISVCKFNNNKDSRHCKCNGVHKTDSVGPYWEEDKYHNRCGWDFGTNFKWSSCIGSDWLDLILSINRMALIALGASSAVMVMAHWPSNLTLRPAGINVFWKCNRKLST